MAVIFARIIKKSGEKPIISAGQPLWYRFRRFESGDFAVIRVMINPRLIMEIPKEI